MPTDFMTLEPLDEILEDHINQFSAWLNGDTNYYHAAFAKANDASNPTLKLQNVGTGGWSFQALDSTGVINKLLVNDAGVWLGNTAAATGDLHFPATFAARFRNAANNADLDAIVGDGADNLTFGKITGVLETYLAGVSVNLYAGSTRRFRGNSTGVAFNTATPIAAPDYTISNPSTSRSIDVSAATLAELRAVVGTVIQDLLSYGLFQ